MADDWYVLTKAQAPAPGTILTACPVHCMTCRSLLAGMGGPQCAICVRCISVLAALTAALS